MKSRPVLAIALAFAFVLLTACGGGGGGGGPSSALTPSPTDASAAPAAPTLSLGYDIKQLKFTWSPMSGVTYYRLLENPDGVSGYTQVGSNLTATAYDHGVFLPQRVNARYRLEACNSAGCTGSSEVFMSASLAAGIGYIKASNTEAGDRFGTALAISGDGTTLAVAAIGEGSKATGIGGDQNDNSASESGAVYVYIRSSGGTWTQQAYIKASNTSTNDHFGRSLALNGDGNTLAVGANSESSGASGIGGDQNNSDALSSGAVYVYARSGSTWTQQAYVKASNTRTSAQFGASLALSDDGATLAVGAYGVDAAYIYTRSGSTWTEQAYVKPSNKGVGVHFGWSLALSGDGTILAVGDDSESSDATGIGGDQNNYDARDAGAVYVYARNGGTWTQQAYVKASNTTANDKFGTSLALSGDGTTLAVGARGESSAATGIGGKQNDDSAPAAGAVYAYTRSGSTWTQQAYVKASNTTANAQFGTSLAINGDGTTLAVGAVGESSAATGIGGNQKDNSAPAAGAAYVYTRSGSAWVQQAYIKASNTAVNEFAAGDDSFGTSLALTNDGAALAVGAPGEGGGATGIGGDQSNKSEPLSGAVYLY